MRMWKGVDLSRVEDVYRRVQLFVLLLTEENGVTDCYDNVSLSLKRDREGRPYDMVFTVGVELSSLDEDFIKTMKDLATTLGLKLSWWYVTSSDDCKCHENDCLHLIVELSDGGVSRAQEVDEYELL